MTLPLAAAGSATSTGFSPGPDAPALPGADAPALTEWAAVTQALLDGRQAVLLRKGGIREKAFVTAQDRFVLFPTVAHSHAERVRPEHRDLLAAGERDVDERAGTFTVRCAVTVVDAVAVAHAEAVAELEDLHIWTSDHVAERVAFRPKHPLSILVVRAFSLPPVRLPRLPEYDGCKSWVDLPLGWPGGWENGPEEAMLGEPVLTDDRLHETAQRVRKTLVA